MQYARYEPASPDISNFSHDFFDGTISYKKMRSNPLFTNKK